MRRALALAVAVALLAASPAAAHQGNPNFRSVVDSITPAVKGVTVHVLNYDDRFELTNDARRDLPSTLICTAFTSEQYQTYAREHPEWSFLAGIPELRNATWIDLPTSHWPMWSKPKDVARIIGDVASEAGNGR